jgi:hypothetical protein
LRNPGLDLPTSGRAATSWFTFPRAIFVAVVLATLVRLPSFASGWVGDDYVILLGIEGVAPTMAEPFDLWRFYDGSPEHMRRDIERGLLPWWTFERANRSLWRPLSSAVLVATHWLFGRRILGYHLVTLAAALAAVVSVGLLFSRIAPGFVGVLGLFLFATSGVHGWATTCASGIHHSLCAAAAALAVRAHVDFREDGRQQARWISLLALALGLGFGEAGVLAVGYLATYELFGRADPLRQRLRHLGPPLGVLLVYSLVRHALGKGVFGIPLYVDPVAEPQRFWLDPSTYAQFGARLLTLASGVFPEWTEFVSEGFADGVRFAASSAFIALVFWGLLSRSEHLSGPVRWMLAGAAITVVPGLSSPTTRALVIPSIGVSLAVSAVLAFGLDRCRAKSGGAGWRVLALLPTLLFGIARLALDPRMMVAMTGYLRGLSQSEARAVAEFDLPSPRTTDVIVLVGLTESQGPWGGAIRGVVTGEPPRSWQALSLTATHHEVTRLSSDTFDLAALEPEPRFDMDFYRDSDHYPMHSGDEVTARGFNVRVLETDHGSPRRILVRFDRPLDDPSLCFVTYAHGAQHRVTMPPIGSRLRLTMTQ